MHTTVEHETVSRLLPWSVAWAAIRTRTLDQIRCVAGGCRIEPSALEKVALLHLPRFSPDELAGSQLLTGEIERLALRTAQLLDGYRDLLAIDPIGLLHKNDVRIDLVSASLASAVHERFHYLGAAREGTHYGLFHAAAPDFPAAVATVSPLDVEHLRGQPSGKPAGILSRVFAFPWAPRNSISFLLGAVARRLPCILFTYVNPNLGFSGSSYRSANWEFRGTKGILYRYLEGNYVTARQAFCAPKPQLTLSQFELEPLQIWRDER